MKKIAELHSFITSLNLVAAEQVYSVVDNLNVTPCGRKYGSSGALVMAELDYSALFSIERYPHATHSAELLLAQVCSWLMTHDTERLETLVYDVIVDVTDDYTADIDFKIAFCELLIIEPDTDGLINLDAINYRLLP